MNMIKWVSVAADRAVRTIRETHQVNSIAGKIRQYCQEHFAEKISNRHWVPGIVERVNGKKVK